MKIHFSDLIFMFSFIIQSLLEIYFCPKRFGTFFENHRALALEANCYPPAHCHCSILPACYCSILPACDCSIFTPTRNVNSIATYHLTSYHPTQMTWALPHSAPSRYLSDNIQTPNSDPSDILQTQPLDF